MLRATEPNLVATATWHPEFVHRWFIKYWSENLNVIYKITKQATNSLTCTQTHICVHVPGLSCYNVKQNTN
jgi:hypothetical protein